MNFEMKYTIKNWNEDTAVSCEIDGKIWRNGTGASFEIESRIEIFTD